MTYTPELATVSSGTLLRLAWAKNRPITSTLEAIVWYAALDANAKKVCAACHDRSKCSLCVFHPERADITSRPDELLSEA